MDTTSPDENQASSADLSRTLQTILAEQRAWMERAERMRRRRMWWMWVSNLALHLLALAVRRRPPPHDYGR